MQKSDKPAEYTKCTAYGFLDHSLKEDCGIMAISLKGVSNGETKKFTPEFKSEIVLEALSGATSQAELCRKPYNLSETR